MICVVQRVLEARVDVSDERVGAISNGLLVLASIVHDDTPADAEWLAKSSLPCASFVMAINISTWT